MTKLSSPQSETERLEKIYNVYHNNTQMQQQWSGDNAGNNAIGQERTKILGSLLNKAGRLPLTNSQILDVGCSTGHILNSFTRWGASPANLYGVDIIEDRINKAKQRFPESHFFCSNAEQLDFADETFDLLLLFTVFTSILDDEIAHNVAREVRRVLKVGGSIVWYDFRYNNPRNPHVRGMTEQAIHRFFPGFHHDIQTITLLPPLARRLGSMTKLLYAPLTTISLLRTHYIGLLTKQL